LKEEEDAEAVKRSCDEYYMNNIDEVGTGDDLKKQELNATAKAEAIN